MKSLLKIYGKYIASGWAIIILLMAVNLGIFIWIGTERIFQADSNLYGGLGRISELESRVFVQEGEDSFAMQPLGEDWLREHYAFLLILDDDGDVIYAWNQPEELADHYSPGEVAGFSRWYLQDYPVRVWQGERGLLVAGYPKGSLWKKNLEFDMGFMDNLGRYLLTFLAVNLGVFLFLVVVMGYSYYRSLRPLSEGIKALSGNRAIRLKEKGVTSELAKQLNQTSRLLEQQRQTLEARDTARTEWVAGVSHDIRTPLSVIVGYADELSRRESLSPEERGRAEVIKAQSLRIRQLIEDLNLTSRLEYQMQPLRLKLFYPAALLRRIAAERLNEGLPERYEMILEIGPELEQVILEGDEALIERAVRNLVDNSIRHNPGGCRIWIAGGMEKEQAVLSVSDDGKGIPGEIVALLRENGSGAAGQAEDGAGQGVGGMKEKPHVMGLRIVKQIALAHEGGFRIAGEGHCVKLFFPTPHKGT